MNVLLIDKPIMKLLIVDDHEAVREGLKFVFAGTDIEVVAEAATAETAVQLGLETEPDAVLLDIKLRDASGFDVLRRLKESRNDLPVLMYSLHDDAHWVRRSETMGASGFLTKGCSSQCLIEAVKRVGRGETWWKRDGVG